MSFARVAPEFTLRLADEADCEKVWRLANDPVVRAVSFSSQPISWETHVAWFRARLADPRCLFYVAEGADSAFIGQARYEIEDGEAVVSIAVCAEWRGRGYAPCILQSSAQSVFAGGGIRRIRAYVKPENAASLRAFAKAGYRENGLTSVRGQSAVEFILSARPEENEKDPR